MCFDSMSPWTTPAANDPTVHESLERTKTWAYVLVAAASFLIGLAIGQMGAVRSSADSQLNEPRRPPHPRSLQP